MAKKIIQIVSPDTDYINRIAGKLAAAIEGNYMLDFITDEEYYKTAVSKPRHIDTLMIDEKLLGKYSDARTAGRVFVISEDSGKGNAIRKYEGSVAILKALGDEVLKRDGGAEKRKCQIVGVISPYGGCGKTAAALGISLRLSQLHRKVLYIDAENTQYFYEKLPKAYGEAVYADKKIAESLFNLTTDSYDYIKGQIVHGRFDYLPAFEKSLMHYHITPGNLCKFAEIISSKGEYDYIVIEHENSIDKELMTNMANEQRLVIVSKSSNDDFRLVKMLEVLDGIDADKIVLLHGDNVEYIKEVPGAEFSETVAFNCDYDLEQLNQSDCYRKTAEAVL